MLDTCPSGLHVGSQLHPARLRSMASPWGAFRSKHKTWTRAALSLVYNVGGESWFTARHKSARVQNNQPRFLGLNMFCFALLLSSPPSPPFFFKQKHVLIYDTSFCRFTLTLMNCLCKNKSFIPVWILFGWLGTANSFRETAITSFKMTLNFKFLTNATENVKQSMPCKMVWFFLMKFIDSKWIFLQCFVLTVVFKCSFSTCPTPNALPLKASTVGQCSAPPFAQRKMLDWFEFRSKPRTPQMICYGSRSTVCVHAGWGWGVVEE